MNIELENSDLIRIRTPMTKAQDLLDGLIAHRSELGELGETLIRQLEAAGVSIQASTENQRFEYMPPVTTRH